MTADPFTARDFAHALERLGPFERRPHLAVAVSGGADSLSLVLFAAAWARRKGGRVTALTVDHGLRREATAEARRVGGWLRARGIAHRVLKWSGPKPTANIQAAARAARYAILSEWCRRNGVLHLLVAHHADDQAETYLLRLARGSGVDGLAAMAPVLEFPGVRILRPLLDVPRVRLESALKKRAQKWVDDPTNRNRAHARVRMRELLPALSQEGMTGARLAKTAARLADARNAIEAAVADLLAAAADLHPAGFVLLEPHRFSDAPREVALRALARILRGVGGIAYPPPWENLARLRDEIAAAGMRGGTLSGCRVMPWRGAVLVCREFDAAEARLSLAGPAVWDNRFAVSAAPRRGVSVGALGAGPRSRDLKAHLESLPAAVRPSLPAFWDRKGLLAVPAAGYTRQGTDKDLKLRCKFKPAEPLMGAPFAVV